MTRIQRRTPRNGAILVLFTALLPVLIVLAGFAINVSHMELCRTELRTSTDAAARASGRTLALTGDVVAARTAGRDAAGRNEVAGSPLLLADSDFNFGRATRPSQSSRYVFTPGGTSFNSVQVVGRREAGSPGGPITLFFPSFLGAHQYQTTQEAISTQVELDVCLVIDRSGSMAYADTEVAAYPPGPAAGPVDWEFCDPVPSPSRWVDTVGAVSDFLDILSTSPQSEFVSLVTYSDSSSLDVDLTSSYSSIVDSLNGHCATFCGGGTAIGRGINEGVRALTQRGFDRYWAAKVIIVLTDGIHNTGESPESAAENASDGGIMVFAVTFSDEADQETMEDVADDGGGRHFHAAVGSDLQAVFQDIAHSLPSLITR